MKLTGQLGGVNGELEIIRLNLAVDEFAGEMKKRLTQKAKEGYEGWDGKHPEEDLLTQIEDDCINIGVDVDDDKKTCVDIANRAMMLWNRGVGQVVKEPAHTYYDKRARITLTPPGFPPNGANPVNMSPEKLVERVHELEKENAELMKDNARQYQQRAGLIVRILELKKIKQSPSVERRYTVGEIAKYCHSLIRNQRSRRKNKIRINK